MTKRPDIAEHLPNRLKASPSSLGTLRRCARAWYAEKVMELRPEPTAKQQASFDRGTALHTAIEEYLGDKGKDAPADELAALALGFLARLRDADGLTVEQQVSFERCGIVVRGFIDAYTDKGILDFKTSSNIEKWGERAETLPQNLQLMLYAYWWFGQRPEAETCIIGHLQFQTKGKATWRFVHGTVTRGQVWEYMEHVVDPLLWLQAHTAAKPDLGSVPPTYSACGEYGGCPHRVTCAKMDHAKQERMLLDGQAVVEAALPGWTWTREATTIRGTLGRTQLLLSATPSHTFIATFQKGPRHTPVTASGPDAAEVSGRVMRVCMTGEPLKTNGEPR